MRLPSRGDVRLVAEALARAVVAGTVFVAAATVGLLYELLAGGD